MQFPVLTIKERSISVVPTMDDLTRCTQVALKNGYHRRLEIVDSAGLRHRVKDAVKAETLVRSWNTGLFLNPIIRVELEMEGEGRPIALDGVKQLVLKAFAADPIFWDAAGNLDELREAVRRAESVQEVMGVLRDMAKA